MSALTLCVGAGAAARAQGIPAVARWLVYNSTLAAAGGGAGRDNGFNAANVGWSMQQAGFLTAAGQPLPRDGMGNILNMAGGQVIGQRVLGGGGFVNTTTSVGIADMGRTTLQAVYNTMLPFQVDEGTLHISAHGGLYRDRQNVQRFGGSLYLDNNRQFAGFREPGTMDNGTGAPNLTPYAITAAVNTVGGFPDGGGRFQLELYNCFSGADPDGAGPVKSVAATGGKGFGQVVSGPGMMMAQRVTAVRSSAPIVVSGIIPVPSSPNVTAAALYTAAQAAMVQRARDVALFNARIGRPGPTGLPANTPRMQNQFGNQLDPTAWMATLPFDQHFSALNANLNVLRIGNQNVPVSWGVQYRQLTALGLNNGSPVDYNTDFPVTWENSDDGALITYTPPTGLGLGATFLVDTVSGGTYENGAAALHLSALSDFYIEPPDLGLALATSIMRLNPYGGMIHGVAGMATLDFGDWTDPDSLELYRYTNGQWVQFSGAGNRMLDEGSMTISADFSFFESIDEADGVLIAGFANAVPAPGAGFVLFASIGGLAARRRR